MIAWTTWLVPYLVAYSAPNVGEYGLEHVFKAVVHSNITLPEEAAIGCSDVCINFSCRPMTNSSVIQCRTDSASMDKYEVSIGSSVRRESAHYDDIGLSGVIFQVEFDRVGISRVWFLNVEPELSTKRNMIRAMIEPMSVGISLAGKEFENYVAPEKSIIGTCTTDFNVRKKILTKKEAERETTIEGFSFDVPALNYRANEATIVIEKNRNLNDCAKKTPHFFGSTEEEDTRHGYSYEKHITYSKSEMYLGGRSFSAYTEHVGTIMDIAPKKSDRETAGQLIRVSLQAIRPAKEKLWVPTKEVGAGFEPGTPWPERY